MYSINQTRYFQEYLTIKNCGDNVARLSSSLFESKITLNPHQINAALAFFKNPKRKGLILADEVGLGKTIEAGLVISQYWYEKKDKILIIAPASLIRQWSEELFDKFHLPSTILDSKTIKEKGAVLERGIYITSINAVYLNKDAFKTKFDIVVIDEAHKLRNVYKDKGVLAPAIKEVFAGQKKLLLSATPFQNNLLELFGLISLIDENVFPDIKVFREKYVNDYLKNKEDLKNILSNYIVRTLRKDVVKYINYTKRNVIIADYGTQPIEDEISTRIANLLYSDDFSETYSAGQNQLLIVLLQKLLSSSIYAVKSTLNVIKNNLVNGVGLIDEFEGDDALTPAFDIDGDSKIHLIKKIEDTISYIDSVTIDSKYDRLLKTLDDIFANFEEDSERNKKVLIFTESKKTQEYLYNRLIASNYKRILTFNGDNSNSDSAEIYKKWLAKQTHLTGNKSINMRKAVIEAFEQDYDIMIATDSAAEGLNMQFCSVIINYDLPWNPQKIEQRIGRCHRYGQKNDVIVLNLLNTSRQIDKRIYELLSSKLGVFEETFGSSDAILGNTTLADDIEEAIKNVYRKCRKPEEIEKAFIELQNQFKEEIEEAVKKSENSLEEFFDAEVSKAFDLQYVEASQLLNEMEEILFLLAKCLLKTASFNESDFSFEYQGKKFSVLSETEDALFCSLSSELGKTLIDKVNVAKNDDRKYGFNYSKSKRKIGFLDDLVGLSGKMTLSKIIYDSFESSEALVLTAILEDGTIVPQDVCHKLLKIESDVIGKNTSNIFISGKHEEDIQTKISEMSNHIAKVFEEELEYIDNWADALIEKIQLDVKLMREERKAMQIEYDFATTIEEKTRLQEAIHRISKKINKAWIELANSEDEIEERRMTLINNLRAEKEKSITTEKIFEMDFVIR